MEDSLPPPIALYQLATAHYHSQALYVAAKLGVADHLAEGPRDAEMLARATHTHAPSLRRVLRLLVSLGVFVEDEEGRFALSPVGAFLRSGPGSFRSSVQLFAGPSQWRVWGDLLRTVESGEPAFHRVFGTGPFEYFADRPEEAAVFDDAMGAFTAVAAAAVAEGYDFAGMHRILDVGGGDGALMAGLLRQNASLSGAVLDLSRVREAAERRIREAELGDRLSFVAGDFFESIPGGFDGYLLKHVIHDWDDERSRAILGNVRRAIGASAAKLLLVESVYPARVDATTRGAAANDCNMMVATGGQQRSEAELRALYEAAGFRLARIVPTAMASVIEGVPV